MSQYDATELQAVRRAVEQGLLTPAQVDEALRSAPAGGTGSLLDRLVELGRLTPEQRDALRPAGSAAETISAAATALVPPPPRDHVTTAMPGLAPASTAGTVAGAPEEDEPGRLLAGRLGKYRILGELGRGAMGVVYRAEDTELRREVALKTVRLGGAPDPELITRFLREARTAATLDHPGIVPVHDMGAIDGIPFFAMGLVRGRTLEEAFAAGEPADLRERVRLLAETARAVAHAHERRVVHRDLKPSNILLDETGRTHVTDFGVAKRLDEVGRFTSTGEVLGTPLYMSPEQMNGERDRIGPASDVYSLGAILYQAATGRPPWVASTLLELAAKVEREELASPARANAAVDGDLANVILKALERDGTRRYAHAGELAQDLERWLKGEPVLAKPVSRVTRLWRRAVRHRAVLVPVLVLCLAGLAAAGDSLLARRRAAREQAEHRAAGLALRALGKAAEARDEFQKALMLDAADGDSRAGLEWAEAEARREAAAAERTRESLRKAGLAQRVVVRWATLAGTVAELERAGLDARAGPAERERRCAGLWARLEPFLQGTADDATSQATMRALAGWARRLAGHAEEGVRWMREAAVLDPDLPYAQVVEAMACFDDWLATPLGAWTAYGSGRIRFWSVADETPAERALRGRIEDLLARAQRAPVWGEEFAREYRGVSAAIGALREGRFADAESELSSLLEAAPLPTFRATLLLARAKVRCFATRFAEALPDLEALAEARPGWLPGLRLRGFAAFGVGEAAWGSGGDPFPWYDRAVGDFAEGRRIAPDDGSWCAHLGLAQTRIGSRREAHGLDARPAYEQALAAYDEEVRLTGGDADARHRRGNLLLALARCEKRAGIDSRARFRAAAAEFDAEARASGGPEPVRWRGLAWAESARIESARGEDPREALARAIADLDDWRRRRPDPPLVRTVLLPLHLDKAQAEAAWAGDPAADLEAALAFAEEWLREVPGDPDGRAARAWALLGLGRGGEAGADVQALAAERPDDPVVRALASVARGSGAAWARDAVLARAGRMVEQGDYAGARPVYERALADAGDEAGRASEFVAAHYNLACIRALLGSGRAAPNAAAGAVDEAEVAAHLDAAFAHLRAALALGWRDLDHLRADPDLAGLHGDPRWTEIAGR